MIRDETCRSKICLLSQKKKCKEEKTELPDCLIQKTANHCTREGVNYSLQCLDCALEGVAAVYWGESGLSACQRHQVHKDMVDRGDVASPMVIHSMERHGGARPNYLSLISCIEDKPLYRAICESVQISEMEDGPNKLNRCNEWGAPRVPVLTARGGDQDGPRVQQTANPRPDWTRDVMEKIQRGTVKRIKYWTKDCMDPDDQDPQDPTELPAPQKRPRVDSLSVDLRQEVGENRGGEENDSPGQETETGGPSDPPTSSREDMDPGPARTGVQVHVH